jgi:NTE family protein
MVMRFYSWVFLSCFSVTFCLASELLAQAEQPVEKIGLVLGGGGARGAAHVGVLKVLEREKVPIAFIAGTSMGAIVGGLYAAGYSADEVERRLASTDWNDVLRDDSARRDIPMERKNDSFQLLERVQFGIGADGIKLPRGLIQGQKLLLTFRQHLLPVSEITHFDQLSIPFRCVASNLADGSAVIFEEGDLAFAIRASASVPGVFQPVRDEQRRLLVDGMLAANVPVDVARAMGATRLIVVDVGEALTDVKEINSPLSVTNQVLSILLNRNTQEQLEKLGPNDLLIRPQLGATSTADFPKTPAIIKIGEQAAEAAISDIRRFSASEAQYAQFARTHQLPTRAVGDERIAFVKVRQTRSRSAAMVERQLSDLVGQPFDPAKINTSIGNAFGDARYERISYSTERDKQGRLGLTVLPVDKGWGPNFLRFGLALDDDFEGESSYRLRAELRMTGRNKHGGEWRNRLDLGKETGIRSEFFQPYGARSSVFVRPFVDLRVRVRRGGEPGESEVEYRNRRYSLGAQLGFDQNAHRRYYAELATGRDYSRVILGEGENAFAPQTEHVRFALGVLYDTLDDSQFPRSGARFTAKTTAFAFQADASNPSASQTGLAELSFDRAMSFDEHTLLFGISAGTQLDDEDIGLRVATLQSLGGLTNLSGVTDARLFGSSSMLARAIYYRRFVAADKLFDAPVYLGASIERGNVWRSIDDVCGCDMLTAGSIFFGVDTILGPMYLGFGRASSGDDAVYLNFGSLAFGRE